MQFFSVPESRSGPTVAALDGRMALVGSMERLPSLPRSGQIPRCGASPAGFCLTLPADERTSAGEESNDEALMK